MSDIFSSIGSFISSSLGQGVLKAGTVGGGFLQNFLANREAQQKQKFVENLITNPTKWASYVSGFNKPLAAGLTSDIARETDAYGAERGLGSSPAIMKDVYAQALAPYIQNEQSMAQNAALQSLGIYEESPTTRPMDVTSLLKMFMSNPATKNGPQPINVSGGAMPTPSQGQYGPWPAPPQGPGGIGTVPDGQTPFDYASLIDYGGAPAGAF